MRYKCHTCKTVINIEPENQCPICGEAFKHLEKMCPNDKICTCNTEIISGLLYCSICGKPCCPCGSEDVAQISRVTGYLADVGGFNNAKKQELKDRVKWNL